MFWGDHWDGKTRLIDMMDVFDSCLQHIFSFVKYSKDKSKFFEYLQGHREEMKQMDEEGGEDVCQAIEELIEDGRMEGNSCYLN